MHMCMWMPPLAAWRVVRLICVTNEKKHLSQNPLSASCSGNWNDGWRPVQGALFVALVTVCRCRRREGGGENPLARWAAMPIRRALAGHYFLLAWHVEIAP